MKTKSLNNEILLIITTCAMELTSLQNNYKEASNLAYNLWRIYEKFGGPKRKIVGRYSRRNELLSNPHAIEEGWEVE